MQLKWVKWKKGLEQKATGSGGDFFTGAAGLLYGIKVFRDVYIM